MDYINTKMFYEFCEEINGKLKIIYKGVDGKPLSKSDVDILKKVVLEKIGQFSCKPIQTIDIESEDVIRNFNRVFALCSEISEIGLIIRSCRDAKIGASHNSKFDGLCARYDAIIEKNKNEIEIRLPRLQFLTGEILEARGTTRNKVDSNN